MFTKKQLKDLEVIEYFIPNQLKDIEISDKDRKMFLENSERGLHRDLPSRDDRQLKWCRENNGALFNEPYTGFEALKEGKRWRGINIYEIWKPGVLNGVFSWAEILNDCPLNVQEFIKKELKWQ